MAGIDQCDLLELDLMSVGDSVHYARPGRTHTDTVKGESLLDLEGRTIMCYANTNPTRVEFGNIN